MRIVHIDEMLEVCQEHLETTDSYGTTIETLLTYALLVRIYAEFEQLVEAIIDDKIGSIADLAQRATFDAWVKDHYRGIRIRGLSELLGSFGAQHRAAWLARRPEHPLAEPFYSNIVEHRHQTTHESGSRATFREVRDWYAEGHIVLDFFRETLFAIDPA